MLKQEILQTNDTMFCAILDGKTASNKDILITEFAKAFQYYEFGSTWDSLYRCMTDLSWIKQSTIMLYIKNIGSVLSDENSETRDTFCRIIESINEFWFNAIEDENFMLPKKDP